MVNDSRNQGIKTILSRIEALSQQGIGSPVANGALGQYIDKLMGEENFPVLSEGVKEQFHNQLLAVFKEYIASKERSFLSDGDQTEGTPGYTHFLDETFSEFKDVYQGMVSPPPMTSTLSPAPVA